MATHKSLPAKINPEDITARLANLETGWHCYHCKLVTPMYGGGVEAGKVDEKMPIRATAIRGQLRFWWRIINQRQKEFYEDGKINYEKLFEAERAIWGGLGNSDELAASKVLVKIAAENAPSIERCAEFSLKDDKQTYRPMPKWSDWAKPYAYVLFSGQGNLSKTDKKVIENYPAKLVREGFEWNLFVRYERLSEEQQSSVNLSIRMVGCFRRHWRSNTSRIGSYRSS
ncbi:MAG: type III-B CRISPR module RAMP protein Cmr1 [Sulfuricella sp.]